MDGFLENIIANGALHNMYFYFSYDTDSFSEIKGRKLYRLLVEKNIFLHLGGDVASQSVFESSSLPYLFMTKRFKKGVGFLKIFVEDDDTILESNIETVFILTPKFN